MLTDEEKRILLQNRLFAELPAERLDGLLQKLSSRTACFGKNSVIWGMGERIDHAGIVLSGRVEAWRYTQDGQESLSAVHEAGGSSRTTAGTQRQTVSQALFAPAAAGALIPCGQFRIKVFST